MARGRTEFTKIRGSIFVTVFARNLTYCQRERAARVCTGRTRKNFLPTRLAASFRANMDFPTFYFPRLLPGRYPLSNQPQRLVETIYFTTQTFREFFSNFVSLIERAGSICELFAVHYIYSTPLCRNTWNVFVATKETALCFRPESLYREGASISCENSTRGFHCLDFHDG